MEWIYQTLQWYLVLFCIGIIFFGITKRVFGGFIDSGYAFSKTLGILLLSYGMFILGNFRILPFHIFSLFFLLIIAFVVGYAIPHKTKKRLNINLIVGEELLFIISLVFLVCIRGQEPSLRGLEKFMDFGFINSIMRSTYFPPLDMWYADLPINYYYFGHLSGAVLIKLSGIQASVGYNLILATIFAQAITMGFSCVATIIFAFGKKMRTSVLFGLLGTFIINFGGNLHTLYLFTSGYSPDDPVPFWEILSNYNPAKYWYPNATRFIPFTIHEFPSYSYVVADLHGHVFDIPFVFLTLAILFIFFTNRGYNKAYSPTLNHYVLTVILGFMTAVHYMTNAFDGPIYLLLCGVLFLSLWGFTKKLLIHLLLLFASFVLFSLPFSLNFKPFATLIGVNCSPSFLTNIGKLGPFLFEKGNCQPDPLWMLFILWGFFWISFVLFIWGKSTEHYKEHPVDDFIFILFAFSTFLILIPEFFYIKDIYPAHFRANTMFKLGYQAFIMISIASTYAFYVIVRQKSVIARIFRVCWILPFLFVALYSFYSFPSYYGSLNKRPMLDGASWVVSQFPDDWTIIDYLNKNVKGQPVILEAQGDSYTDFNKISAYTGLPTVAGWWVHEWLWRGTADAVGARIPEINEIYESTDIGRTKQLLQKYHVQYVVVSTMERQKYSRLQEDKFSALGKKVVTSKNGSGVLYQLK